MPSSTRPERLRPEVESSPAFLQPHGLKYSYAFQPIVDVLTQEVFSHEALIRGKANESAFQVLSQVPENFKHRFDQQSRVVAIALAARLGLPCHLNLNFLPQSLFVSDNAISTTLEAAEHFGLAIDRLVIEVTEGEVIVDYGHMATQLNKYRLLGVKLAIDDFGAGYSGLNMLADFQPDQVKIDMNLVREIESHGPRQSIVRAILQVCGDLGIDVIAEGVETLAEFEWFVHHGVRLFQGYLFARPGFETFPSVHYPALA